MKKIVKNLLLILCFSFMIACKQDNSEYLKKYTINKEQLDERYIKMYEMKHQFVSVKYKEYDNLFDGEFIKFKNLDDSFVLTKRQRDMLTTNIYKNADGLALVIWKFEIDDNLQDENYTLDENMKNNYPDVDILKTYKRHNIKNIYDVIYNIIKYMDINVDEHSSKEEIIDKFTFDYLLPIDVPYSQNLIFFTGDQYGYVMRQEDRVYIFLLYDSSHELRIFFQYDDKRNVDISDEQIIELVSSIKKQ